MSGDPSAGNELSATVAALVKKAIDKELVTTADAAVKKAIIPKDFFWDQFVKYLASVIALLTTLDIAVQFLRDASLLCYPPLDVTSRDQAAYINAFCLDSLSRSEFYPVFILITAIFLAGPHYVWSIISEGQLNFFFSTVEQLDQLRDPMVGEYRPRNFDFVSKLERKFSTNKIIWYYRFKLCLQVLVASLGIIINGSVFQPNTFKFAFQCPCINASFSDTTNCSLQDGWPFSFTVWCIYPSFRMLLVIWGVNFVLLFVALVMTGYGLVWTIIRHTNALGHKSIAKFAFASGLTPEEYVFESFLKNPCNPGIGSDLDFLLLRLFRANTGHGQVFKDILVAKELKHLANEEHNRLSRDISGNTSGSVARSGNGLTKVLESRVKSIFDSYIKAHPDLNPQTPIAHDICFGTMGFTFQLACRFGYVLSLNIHPFYRNAKEVVKDETFETRFTRVTWQDDILSQNASNIEESNKPTDRVLGDHKPIYLVIVGPFTEKSKEDIVSYHIQRLRTKEFFATEESVLVTVRPLKIRDEDVSNRFCKYIPPKRLFKSIGQEEIKCDDVYCKFEFLLYRYIYVKTA